ncbi:MAG TPA: glycoside hydrolase family 130 protein [Phycisphaeraceae bacterium]
MLTRLFTHRLLGPEDLEPSDPRMKVVGVFNPGVAAVGQEVVILVRVVEQPVETRQGFEPSPRYDPQEGLVFDWLDERELDFYDPRVFHIRGTGLERLRFVSYLKVFRSRDGKTFDPRDSGPVIMPEGVNEEYGIEDPRITRIGQTYYITYVAVSRHGVSTCLMSSTDLQHFRRHGIIFCPENKDVLLFPEKIAGDYVAIHRPVTSIRFRPPQMWLARSPDLIHWGGHEHLLGAQKAFENSRLGGGTPPIKTPHGWLTLYHGSQRREGDPGPGVYSAGALLLDLHHPKRILAQTPEPVMTPQMEFEQKGFVRDVVFPTGVVEQGEELHVYYGAADESVGVVGFAREELLSAMLKRV